MHSKRTPAKNNHKSGGTVVDTTLKRTKKEIEDLDSQAIEAMEHGSKYPGMSYEEGIRAALDWLFDRDQPHPFED